MIGACRIPYDCDSFSSLSPFTLTIVGSFSEALAQSGAFILHPTTSQDANSVSLGACHMIVMAFGRLKRLQFSMSVDALLMSAVMEFLQCIAGYHHPNLLVLLVLAILMIVITLTHRSQKFLLFWFIYLLEEEITTLSVLLGNLQYLTTQHPHIMLLILVLASYDCDFCLDTRLRITIIVGGSTRDGDGSGPSSFATATISSSAIWWIGACL